MTGGDDDCGCFDIGGRLGMGPCPIHDHVKPTTVRPALITEDDARAEGVNPSDAHIVIKDGYRQPDMERTHRGAFACLWDGINGDRASWASNPWVWRVEFRVVQP